MNTRVGGCSRRDALALLAGVAFGAGCAPRSRALPGQAARTQAAPVPEALHYLSLGEVARLLASRSVTSEDVAAHEEPRKSGPTARLTLAG
jgi:hypothetical protein